MTAGILVNIHRADALEAAQRAASWLISNGHSVGVERESAPYVKLPAFSPAELIGVDLMLSFGGDGTLIRASHLCSLRSTPILGVFYGSFGFVTPCEPGQVEQSLQDFVDGKATLEDRMMICTELIRNEHVVAELHSLNEAVVQRTATTRILVFEVKVNGYVIAKYPADGVMAATPTGSTAYNLSAGGPIVDPRMKALLISAVMPHTLSARSLVLPESCVIEIDLESSRESHGEAVLSCDGQSRLHMLHGDRVRITVSPRITRLVKPGGDDFLEKLSDNLTSKGRGRLG